MDYQPISSTDFLTTCSESPEITGDSRNTQTGAPKHCLWLWKQDVLEKGLCKHCNDVDKKVVNKITNINTHIYTPAHLADGKEKSEAKSN